MRLFIAIELTEGIKTEIEKIVDKLQKSDSDVKWVRAEGIHITLKFLGEIDEKRKNEIQDVLQEIVKTRGPFTVSFKGIGVFPDLRRPRVIWIGIEKGRDELKELAKKIESPLVNLNFPEEKREFSPHLTLGRVRSASGIEELKKAIAGEEKFALPELNVGEIILMQSILKREGAEYKKVKIYNLHDMKGEGNG